MPGYNRRSKNITEGVARAPNRSNRSLWMPPKPPLLNTATVSPDAASAVKDTPVSAADSTRVEPLLDVRTRVAVTPVSALAAKLVEAGYVDDAAFAKAKSGSLLRRGYGGRRVTQALVAAGIAEELREHIRPGEAEERHAALALARKRRFGPFGSEPPDRAGREKQLAAMLRAGHRLDNARELVDAPSVEAAEEWAAETCEDD